jgi:hypothetical protein
MLISLSAIRTDGGTQSRASIDDSTVDDYAEALSRGEKFPPVVVFCDEYWLADGFHRLASYERNDAVEVEADVREGSQRDAILFSLSANETHGLRRTRADKRKSVETVLADPEWSKWSDREIAKQCEAA